MWLRDTWSWFECKGHELPYVVFKRKVSMVEHAVHSRVVVLKEQLNERRIRIQHPQYTPRVVLLRGMADSYVHILRQSASWNSLQ